MNPQNPVPPVPQPNLSVNPTVPAPVPPTVAPVTPGVAPVQTAAPAHDYATISQRFWAVLLDGLILGVISFVITLPFTIAIGMAGSSSTDPSATVGIQMISNLLNFLINIGYALYFIGKKGQTPGKMVLKIKVIKKDNPAEEIGFMGAFLRESVGKLLSSFLLLGYITAFKDPNKQTWHDKIANTVVVKVA